MKLTNFNFKPEELIYFIELDDSQKKNILSELDSIIKINTNKIPPSFRILMSSLPTNVKNVTLKKIDILNKLRKSDSEYHKLNKWVNGLLEIPWNKYKPLPVNNISKTSDIVKFLNNSQTIMDKILYGQKDTKTHIIQLIGKMISNPESVGNVFSIYGPMGTGKTTIIKEGLSEVLGLPFVFISLGGCSDSSYLDGHNYTYEGSIPGKIVDSLKLAKYMNPVFFFDELDKVSETSRGMEIINLLIHLTDPSQNNNFQDKYYSNIPFDLSKAMFVFSFNDINKINPILKDRMNCIKVSGFTVEDKFHISKDFLLPSIFKNYNLTNKIIDIDSDTIKYIINKINKKEEGVRNIKRRFEIIVSKCNLINLYVTGGKFKGKAHTIDKKKYNILFEHLNIKSDTLKIPLKLTSTLIDNMLKIPPSNIPDFMYS